MDTLIITGTVNPSPRVPLTIRDPNERLLQYIVSLILWSKRGPFSQIVFVENSNYGKRFEVLRKMPSLSRKSFEIITYDGAKQCEDFGKGYGESEMFERASQDSDLARSSECIWKAGGRLFLVNCEVLEKAHRGHPNVMNSMDHRFFKFSKSFFTEKLLRAYKKANDHTGREIERVYAEILEAPSKAGEVVRFVEPLQVIGQCATSGDWHGPLPNDVIEEARAWRDEINGFHKA